MWLGRPSGSNPTSSLDNQSCHLLPASPYPSGPRHLQTSLALALSLPLVLPGPPLSLTPLPSHSSICCALSSASTGSSGAPGSLSSSLLLWSLAQAGGQSPLGPLGVSFSWNTSPPRGGWAQGGTQGRWQALSLVSATTVRHTALASSQPHSRRSAAPWPCAPSGSVPVGPTWPQPGRRSR